MLVGEQPGSQEDIEGKPFVGPAGKLLREALSAAGLPGSRVYMTNTVKHFKYEMRGKARLHKRASATEQAACRMWLAAEIARVRPLFIVGLGSMAAQTMFGSAFLVSRQRGRWHVLSDTLHAMATWHPSAILRMKEPQRAIAWQELVEDLKQVALADARAR